MGLFDEKKEPVIFDFGIDETAKAYILQTVVWTKFIAIMIYIFSGLMLILAGTVCYLLILPNNSNPGSDETTMIYTCVFSALAYLYPSIMLFRFSTNIKSAMAMADQQRFTLAMKYQRNMYRYIGIMIITSLTICGLLFLYVLMMRR